jgi:hypothetical protein
MKMVRPFPESVERPTNGFHVEARKVSSAAIGDKPSYIVDVICPQIILADASQWFTIDRI